MLNAESDTISAIDTASLEVVRTFVVASDTTDLAFAAAGDELFLSQPVSDAILVIDLDGNVRRRFESPPPWPAAPHRLALLAEPSRSDAGTR